MAIDAAKLMVMVAADTGPAEKGLQSFSGKMGSLAGGMGAIGAGMSLAITAPLVGIATSALTMAADFEKSMNVMEVAGGFSADAMAKLEKQAMDLGATTVFSAGDVAGAMLELTKAGQDQIEVSESIQGVTELAAAGEMDLAEAANVAVSWLSAFNLEASKTGEITNLLAGGANASTASVHDLALGGRQAGGTFNTLDMSASDLVTTLALLANEGMNASTAGTNINQAMNDLISPTIKSRKELKKLGVDLFDVNGEFIGMIPMIDAFNAATAGMTDEMRLNSLGVVFSGEGLKAMLPLLDATGAGFGKAQVEIEKEGQAAAISEALMKGLAGAMEYLSGSVETFLTGAAKPFLNMVGEWLRGVADMITGIGNLPGPVLAAAGAFLAVLAAAGPVIAVIAGVAGAFALLGGAVAGPIFLIVGAVAALAAAFAGDFLGIRTTVMGAIESLRPAFGELLGWISSAAKGDFGPLKAGLQGALNSVTATIEAFRWEDFVTKLGDWSEFVSNLIWKGYISTLNWDTQIDDFLWDTYVLSLTWDTYVKELDWKGLVVRLADWAAFIPGIIWDTWIDILSWEAHIGKLVWDFFVPKFGEWGAWISKLDWKVIIGTGIDWAMWIPALLWNEIVDVIDWATIIGAFVWSEWISKLKWSEVIPTVLDWGTWIINLDWAGFITKLVDWGKFIGSVAWSSFIEKIKWPMFITAIDWHDYIEKLTWDLNTDFLWGDFIETLAWPKELNVFSWGSYVSKLNWTEIVPKVVDWGTWIPALAWNAFVKFLDWTAVLGKIVWDTWIGKLTWTDVINELADWGTWIQQLSWGDHVKKTDPGTKVPQLDWIDVITKVSDWTVYIHNLAWVDFVDKITWPTFIKDLQWPSASEILQAITDAITKVLIAAGIIDPPTVAPKTGAEGGVVAPTLGSGGIPGLDKVQLPAEITAMTLGPGATLKTTAEVTDVVIPANIDPVRGVIADLQGITGFENIPPVKLPFIPIITADVPAFDPVPVPIIPTVTAEVPNFDPIPVPIIPTMPANVPDFLLDTIPVTAQVQAVLPPMGPMPKIEVEATPIWGTMQEMIDRLSGGISAAISTMGGGKGLFSQVPPEESAAPAVKFEWPPYPLFEWPKLPEFPKFSWPALTKFEWPALPEWMWPDMPKFDWPALPTWTWPALPIFDWPEYPRWTWPSIPQPGWIWPEIPMPGWVSLLLGGPSTSTGAAPAAPAAAGGAMSTKGAYWVGEAGPELVLPSRGSRILTNGESMALAGAGGVTVNLGPVTVQSPLDYEEIAYRVLEVLKRKG